MDYKINCGTAVQVMFWDGECMCPGIRIGNRIACGCCGAVFYIDDILADAKECGVSEPIKVFETWVDISDEIRGDE